MIIRKEDYSMVLAALRGLWYTDRINNPSNKLEHKRIKEACIDNLEEVMIAVKYFKWKDFDKLLKEAKRKARGRFR